VVDLLVVVLCRFCGGTVFSAVTSSFLRILEWDRVQNALALYDLDGLTL